MPHQIEAKEQNVLRVFSDKYLFRIPDYQRPYAWTTQETGELLDDLMMAMSPEDRDSENDVPPYFLGSIVLIKYPDRDTKFDVVDGQQRLTTLTILLCTLRELSEDKGIADDLNERICERGNRFAETEDQFRLSLRKRDEDFFKRNIQNPGRVCNFLHENINKRFSDSQQRIYENTKYLYEKLLHVGQDQRDLLATFLIRHCYFVVVSTSDSVSAHRVFSVMNDRGLDLLPTDILKADVIGVIQQETKRSKYTNEWEHIEERLGRDKFRDLFAHIRMIYMKSKLHGTLHDEFRNHVLKKRNGEEFIDNVLKPLSEAYEIVSNATYRGARGAEELNNYLRYLGWLDNYDWMPPMITFFQKNKDDQEVLIRFARDLERLAYALFIRRANVNERIARYVNVLYAVEQDNTPDSWTSALDLSANDKSSVLNALKDPIYHTRICWPLIRRVDSMLSDIGGVYEHGNLSIEHVLPQTPEDGSIWLSWFPDPDLREIWTHKIANLILLSQRKNTRAQNYEFDKKKCEYFQKEGVTTFAITSQVLNESEWTPQVLERRECELIERIKKEWRL